MATILIPGFLKWDGSKYVLDPDVEGEQGPSGPAGPTGPAATPAPPTLSLQYNNSTVLGGTDNWTYQGGGRINIEGGYITYGTVANTFPTVGALRTSGTGIVNIISSRDNTNNRNLNLVRQNASVTYFGGIGQQTQITGSNIRIQSSLSAGDASDPANNGASQVVIQGGAGGTDFFGNATIGGTILAGNVGFGSSFGMTFGGGGNLIAQNWISDADDGNPSSSSPTQNPSPGSHFLQWVNEPGRVNQFFRGNEKFRWGGNYASGGADGYHYITTYRYSPTFWPKFGPARQEFIGRDRWFYHRRLFFERQKAAGGQNPFHIVRFDMTNECVCSFHFKVTMTRRTTTTSAGFYEGRAIYRRTAGGAPTVVGSPSYEPEMDVVAGNGVTFTTAGNEVWVYFTAADNNDLMNIACVLEVMELYPD